MVSPRKAIQRLLAVLLGHGDYGFAPATPPGIWAQRHRDTLDPTLDINFQFNPLTGKITPVSGDGSAGGGENDASTAYIGYNYSIDNGGEVEHTATVQVHVIAAVGGKINKTESGGVNGGGTIDASKIGFNVSGSYTTTFQETMDDGAPAHDVTRDFQFKLRATEN